MSEATHIWHPKLHQQAGERLYFVRLAFEPVYPEITPDLIRDRLRELGVGSAQVYELIGAHDLVFRVWLSGDVREFVERLRLPELRSADFMAVRNIREHFVLSDSNPNGPLDLDQLTQGIVEEINQAIHGESTDVDLAEYVKKGWIHPLHVGDGIKFFISVAASIGTSANISFDDVLFHHVRQIFDEASNLVEERSIYAGDGFARLLLLGRLPAADYFAFTERILFRLNDQYIRQLFSARTVTAFGSRRSPIFGQELLPPGFVRTEDRPTSQRRTLEELLTEGEGSNIEVKATAFLNFNDYVQGEAPDWSALRPELVKAVCGLLNQRTDSISTLIVGVVETGRFRKWLSSYGEALPAVGDFTLIGVEEDNPSGNWDKYRRRLEDALDSAIAPAPSDFMRMSFEEAELDGKAKLLLRIELEPTNRVFYAKGRDSLWVRRGARVRELHDLERDDFIAEKRARGHVTS
ncbi:MAG: AlbA family DNA-binding domain-containing protein [Solirubrobacteraceae bacterium]